MHLARYVMVFVCAWVSTPSAAQESVRPRVLFDSGQTKPMAPFYARVKAKMAKPPRVSNAIAAHGLRLPITSDLLTPGRVESRPLVKINANIPRAAMRPLFLFGADARSLAWVRQNRERFKALHAVGMLIAARTDSDVVAAQQAVGDLPLFGGSANDIAEALKLEHYPVLITPDGVSQ